MKAYTSLGRFEERSSFYTWLYRLVTNQCIDMRRREHPERRVEWRDGDPLEEAALRLAPDAELPEPTAPPSDELARKELRDQVAARDRRAARGRARDAAAARGRRAELRRDRRGSRAFRGAP